MKPIAQLIFLGICLTVTDRMHAQPLMEIPFGTTPVIDGIISQDEWSDADTLSIAILNQTKTVTVLCKHDGNNLHLAYLGNLESVNARFPEVLLDVNNDKSATWLQDDWWFHVSATDCEYQGQYGNFDSCQLVRPNWTAVPNMTPGAPLTDTIEVQIPFTTINLDTSTSDTIGISFLVTNTFSAFEHWPASANRNNPSTWANAVFAAQTTGISQAESLWPSFTIFPNPSQGRFRLVFENEFIAETEIRIVNAWGQTVFTEKINARERHVERIFDLLAGPGIYWLQLKSGNHTASQTVIVAE